MQAFPVKLPTSERYWTVVDEDHQVVAVVDEYLQHLRLGQGAAESTTKAYAESLALYLRWCEQTGRDWRTSADLLGAFVAWLLSEVFGDQMHHDAGLTRTDELYSLRKRVTELEQQLLDCRQYLQDHDNVLAAARAANRDLMTAIDSRVHDHPREQHL